MNTTTVVREFGCTIDELKDAAKKIDGGLGDAVLGDPVLSRMSSTFKDDYDANLDALVKAITSQAVARGKITELARELKGKLDRCSIRTGMARGLAKRRYAGDDAMLHAEFNVGISSPGGCESIVTRAEKMHAACLAHADELVEAGWPPTETTALAAAIADVNAAKEALHVAKEAKKGATAEVNRLANALYDWCRKVQIVADAVYPELDMQTNAQIPEARGRFLLGVFPPDAGAPETDSGDPTTPAGTGNGTAPTTSSATTPPPTGGAS